MLVPAAVKVPGSTSNLGAGFDTVGLAVARHLTARFEPGGSTLVLEREGTLAELDVADEDDLLWRAFVSEAVRLGGGPVHGRLAVSSDIPVGKGLGSSGAAVVAGLLLAAAVAGGEPDPSVLLERAVELEGHPDNAGPSLLGGLVVAIPTPAGGVRALPLRLAPGIAFAFAAPPVEVDTRAARSALPEGYPRGVAVVALGRLAALLHGLTTGDASALRVGLEDDLHVPYRLGLIPGGLGALQAARDAGAWGATISGSGSGVLAVTAPDLQGDVGRAMAEAFLRAGHDEVLAFPLDPEPEGARAEGVAPEPFLGTDPR